MVNSSSSWSTTTAVSRGTRPSRATGSAPGVNTTTAWPRRRMAGTRPARASDDLPRPDGPTMASTPALDKRPMHAATSVLSPEELLRVADVVGEQALVRAERRRLAGPPPRSDPATGRAPTPPVRSPRGQDPDRPPAPRGAAAGPGRRPAARRPGAPSGSTPAPAAPSAAPATALCWPGPPAERRRFVDPTVAQQRLCQPLLGPPAQLQEPCRLVPARAPTVQVGEGHTLEQLERLPQQGHRSGGLADLDQLGGPLIGPLEPPGIHVIVAEGQPVPVGRGLDGPRPQRLTKPQDRALHHLPPRRRRVIAVERLGQRGRGRRSRPADLQRREHDSIAPAERIVTLDPTRPQHANPHGLTMSALDLLVNGGVTAVLPRRPVPRDRPLARWRHEHVACLCGCRRLRRTVPRLVVGGGHRRWDNAGALAVRLQVDARLASQLTQRRPVADEPAPYFWDSQSGRRAGAEAGRFELDDPATRPPCRPGTTSRTSPAASGSGSTTRAFRPRRGPDSAIAKSQNVAWHVATTLLDGSRAPARAGEIPDWARPRTAQLDGPRLGCSTPLPISTSSRPVVWPAACGWPPPARSAPMVSSRACGWSRPSWLRPAWPARMCSSRPWFPPVRSASPWPRTKARPAAHGAIGDWLNTAGYELAGRAASAHAGEIALVQVDDVRQALAWLCGRTQQPETCAVAHAAAAVPFAAARPYGSPSIPERVAAQRPA